MKNLFTLIVFSLVGFGAISQVEKTIVVEHYTNTRCSVCAARNPGLFSLLEEYPQVLHIAYHPSSPYANCLFSTHNPQENDARTNYYGIYGGTPRLVMQGSVMPVQNPLLNSGQIESVLGQMSDYEIKVTQTLQGSDEVDVSIIVKRVGGSNSQQLMLSAMIAEKEIGYAAPNGENLHHNVFRKRLLSEDVSINNVGDSIVFSESYALHQAWIAGEMFVTVMLQDESSKEILQASASSTLDAGSSSIEDRELLSADGLLYPNPANDVVRISGANGITFEKAEFYALTGKLVKVVDRPEVIQLGTLPEGLYMVLLTDTEQQQHITRLVIN